MNVSVLICTFGSDEWRDLAWSLAYPSTAGQGAGEVIVRHDPDGTLASVRNAAASEATGDWLCFLDADDELDGGYIDAMRPHMRGPLKSRPTLGVEGIEVYEGQLDSLLVPAVQYPGGRPARIPAWGRPLIDVNSCVIGTLVPRRLFLHVGGFRELPALEDWDLWLRCVVAGARLVPVPAAVYCACGGNAVRLNGRNADQTLYRQIRREHEAAYDSRQREGTAP